MRPADWVERWQEGRTGFHLDEVNPLLLRHAELFLDGPGRRVLVPLCGKSRDLLWLEQQGHEVVGVEVAEVAVQAFHRENGRTPRWRRDGRMVRAFSGKVELIVADFFEVDRLALGPADRVYDRAALIALPAEQRDEYVRRLRLLAPQASMLLITVEYDEPEMAGPPYSVDADEVERCFADGFLVRGLDRKDALDASPHLRAKGLTALTEAVYLLTPL